MLVRVLKYWRDLDLLRQTPHRQGEWRGVKFVVDESGYADYVIIHCNVDKPSVVVCPPENIWLVVGEPPNETFKSMHCAPRWVNRIYTNDETLTTPQHVLSYPGLPWHVNKDFDFLTSCPPPEKLKDLSWITSNRTDTIGHIKRMEVVHRLKKLPALNLFGRGFEPIQDKWDGLAPYRYSIAYENYSNSYYWTEKIMDCFLAWTMPLYYGCLNLEQFFPKESFVRIDPNDDGLEQKVIEVVKSDLRERNLAAIEEARRRVLYDYNFFEFVVREIEKEHSVRSGKLPAKQVSIIRNHTMSDRECLIQEIRRVKRRLVRRSSK